MNRYVCIKTYLHILPEISAHHLQLKCMGCHFFSVPSLHVLMYVLCIYYNCRLTCIYIHSYRAYLHEKLSRYREETPLFVNRSNCLDVNIFGVTTLYMIVFLACSVLSLVFRGYFYCICLLFIIANNDILQRVLRAVTKNGKSK